MASTSRTTRDHDEIRNWAEERGGQPACVRNTGGKGDIGILRIDFPGFSGEDTLEHISWDEWFEKFDERNLALLFQEETAGGEKSNFNKIVSEETAEENEARRAGGRRATTKASKRTPAKKGASKSGGSAAAKKAGPKKVSAKKASPKKAPKKAAPAKVAQAAKKTTAKKGAVPRKAAATKGAAKKGQAKKTGRRGR